MDQPPGIPVVLEVNGKRCVIVGGGRVACRRARALVDAGAAVDVYAPRIVPELEALAVRAHPRPCVPADVEGAFLVVIATNDPRINQAMADRARDCGALVNRADDADAGDLTFMASHRDGPLTLSVHTGGASANAAARLRDQLVQHLDPDWARLLTLALPARKQIQQQIDDPARRTTLLRRLTDDQAMARLKSGGDAALHAYYAGIMEGSA